MSKSNSLKHLPFSASRRKLLAAGSALAATSLIPGTVNAIGRGTQVNIKDFYQADWIAAFNKAFAAADVVEVPADVVCDSMNTAIFMPQGKTLHVAGGLKGNGKGRFVLQDNCQIVGEGKGRFNNITLDVRGSDCTIKGIDMSGFVNVAQIYIGGKDNRTMRNLTIDNITVHDANYAILRQGFHNRMENVRITNGHFSHLQGDAIEWNVAINDHDLLISDHVIDNINCTNGKINWGIGIGLAGSTYDNNYPEDQAVKNFVVANITGSNCRQLVHVENGKHFLIRNVKARNINPSFSRTAGIDNATVAIYGCDNFVIDDVDMVNSAGMLIGYGVIKGNYLSIPQNFKLSDIKLDNSELSSPLRGIQISSGNATSFVALNNITLKRASLEFHNKPQHLFMRNINVMQLSTAGPALKLNFDLRKDVRGKFMAKDGTLLSLANIHAVNERGQSSVDIDRIDQLHVNGENLNFALSKVSK
ncbi:colanic acid biosynthesis protein WcaM [Enterobacter sp. Ap-916]|uniref:colanic acid biosynthesis protein WcaM n=1 Tax=unclassified Enterobacter TaxID=2608935 RepID=UPI001422CF24|nr:MULTISPECIES: colanic acid biosynthesis protein WcaM [unclassified Enterobacter]NIF57276.1 colanic acid biosynthesis protein WcaM [Enterobacter sp. Ap-867]NIG28783.1 colanic acid biosynthesis protein WcaM [Enterobacter sp. Ap-916]